MNATSSIVIVAIVIMVVVMMIPAIVVIVIAVRAVMMMVMMPPTVMVMVIRSSVPDRLACRQSVIGAVLTLCRSLPVYPDQRTSSDQPGWSVSCQKQT